MIILDTTHERKREREREREREKEGEVNCYCTLITRGWKFDTQRWALFVAPTVSPRKGRKESERM